MRPMPRLWKVKTKSRKQLEKHDTSATQEKLVRQHISHQKPRKPEKVAQCSSNAEGKKKKTNTESYIQQKYPQKMKMYSDQGK